MAHKLMSAEAAGKEIGVSGESLRRWASEKRIPHVVLPSGSIRFRPADLEAAVKVVEAEQPADGAA